jgi:hypothetical protein
VAKTQTLAFTGRKPIVLPDDANPEWVAVDIEFPAAFASGDYIQLCTLPAGYQVLDWLLNCPDIDSGSAIRVALGVSNATIASPTSTDIGSGNQVWATAIDAVQGVPYRNALNASAADAYMDSATVSGNREIVLKCTTAATGYTGSGKVGQLLMLVRG